MTDVDLLATLFLNPISVTGPWRLALLVPLALGVAVVYKTIRCEHLRDVPVAALVLTITITTGMLAVGVGLLLIFRLLA